MPGAVPGGAGSGAAAASGTPAAARLRSAARRLCSRFFWDLLGGVVLARAGSAGSTAMDGASTSEAIARRRKNPAGLRELLDRARLCTESLCRDTSHTCSKCSNNACQCSVYDTGNP